MVDLVVRKEQDGNEFYYPVVEFYLPDDSLQTVQLTDGSWPAAFRKGEAVTVAYDPAQPRNARVKSAAGETGIWILPAITGFLGVAFLGATLLPAGFLSKIPIDTDSIRVMPWTGVFSTAPCCKIG